MERALLGGEAETVSVPGPETLTKGARAAQAAAQRAAAAGQGPLHAVRGTGQQERMLKTGMIDQLALDVVHDEVPVSEIA